MNFAFCDRQLRLAAACTALAAFALSTDGALASRQANATKKVPSQAAQKPSPFADVERLLQEGKFSEARSRLEAELPQNPSSAEGYALLGVLYGEEKNFPEAIKAFEHSLQLDPRSNKARNSLGNIYVIQGHLDLRRRNSGSPFAAIPPTMAGITILGWYS